MKSEFLKIANVKTQKEFYDKYPNEASFFAAHPEAKHLKTMARGGSASGNKQQQQIMQIIQAYAKASGSDPRQIMQQLQQMQPQQQQQALQQMMQSLQGQGQQMMAQQQGQPQMQLGGGAYITHPQMFADGGSNDMIGPQQGDVTYSKSSNRPTPVIGNPIVNAKNIVNPQKNVSVVDFLAAQGMNKTDYASRKQLAEAAGIIGYKGTSSQNLQLMDVLKNHPNMLNSNIKDPIKHIAKSISKTSISTPITSVSSNNLNFLIDPNNIEDRKKMMGVNKPRSTTKEPPFGIAAAKSMTDPVPFYSNEYYNQTLSKPMTQDDSRYLESGMIEDKNKNELYAIKNGKVVKTIPVMTGLNKNGNINDKGLAWLEAHPEEAKKFRATPVGSYISKSNKDIYGQPGFNMLPIQAFGQPAPKAVGLAQHVVYGANGIDPAEYKRRMKIMSGPGEQRVGSYGCTNMNGQDIDCLTGQLFPQGDTTIVTDSRNPKDQDFLRKKYGIKKMGGEPCYECGGSYAEGGYYMGNDGQRHKSTKANWSGNAFYADGGSAPLEYPHMFKYPPTYEIGPHMAYGGYYQDGGMQQDPSQEQPQQGQGVDPQQIMQEIAQKLQQGEDPNQIVQELVQEGVPQDQAQQMVQQVVQQMQQQAPPDQGQGQPGMKYGGIHINPANKGKFNATKKATGKSTEELTHSKNPITKKRAIFAQNSAKWKHETGGQYGGQYMQDGGISIGQTMDVTPEQAQYLKQMGYTFEKI